MLRLGGSGDLAVLHVEPDGTELPAFEAGQHTTLAFERDGELVERYFSIASAPEERDAWEFYIRRPAPRSGDQDKTDLFDLHPGARLWLSPPGGRFTLGRSSCRHLAFVASGTGLAPFISMLRHLRLSGKTPAGVTLWHGARLEGDLGYRDELETLEQEGPFPFRYLPTLTGEDASGVSRGRVEDLFCSFLGLPGAGGCELRRERESIAPLLPPGDTGVFLCGWPDMIRTVAARAEGTPWEEHLVYDLW